MNPHVRLPWHENNPPGVTGLEDQDNFLRNLRTIITGYAPVALANANAAAVVPTSTISTTIATSNAILSVIEIKQYLRIELDQTAEDPMLTGLEQAAHIHTSNVLQRTIEPGVGENVKMAMLMLISHWYRNRETVSADPLAEIPLAYNALLSPERAFPHY